MLLSSWVAPVEGDSRATGLSLRGPSTTVGLCYCAFDVPLRMWPSRESGSHFVVCVGQFVLVAIVVGLWLGYLVGWASSCGRHGCEIFIDVIFVDASCSYEAYG